MIDFLSAAFAFPVVLWTVPLLLALAYWALVMFGALELELLEAGGDLDAELDGSEGILSSLGLVGVPLTVSLSVLVLFGWGLTFAATLLLPQVGLAGVVATVWGGLLVAGAMAVVALLVTARVVRRLRPLMRTRLATGHRELVGRYCTITTLTVDERFGQAELVDHEGAALLVQVRAAVPNTLTRGSRGLLFDYEPRAGTFHVAPDVTHLDPDAYSEGTAGPAEHAALPTPAQTTASTSRLTQ